uniref:Putative DNA binding, helix-turn-helix domain containing protein n=1 Tax=viral metagenome TaxID=1070528 RepID=A0A6M3JBI2_9ZZZZ
MKKLIKWLNKKGWTQKNLADELGVSESAVSLWFSGDRKPSSKSALKIENITNGTVSRLSLLYPSE